MLEYYTAKFDRKYFPAKWSTARIQSHLRAATTLGLGTNGAKLWTLRQRNRDPKSRQLDRLTLTDGVFQIAVRQNLGAGAQDLFEQVPDKCNACAHESELSSGAFHLLYSCHSHKGESNRRHTKIQRVYEDLAKLAGLTVSRLAPNTTPLSQYSQTSMQSKGKQSFGDWKIHDQGISKDIVFDNSIVGPFTKVHRILLLESMAMYSRHEKDTRASTIWRRTDDRSSSTTSTKAAKIGIKFSCHSLTPLQERLFPKIRSCLKCTLMRQN
eukprot:m.232338 g.232338  ORF g.232338 m.232338 type:complete len:268 (+) comp15713_c0_seq4:2940-3743(+)